MLELEDRQNGRHAPVGPIGLLMRMRRADPLVFMLFCVGMAVWLCAMSIAVIAEVH